MRNPHQSSSSFNPLLLTTTTTNDNGSWFFHLKFFATVIGVYLGLVCWLIFEKVLVVVWFWFWFLGFLDPKPTDLKWQFFFSKPPLPLRLFLLAHVQLGSGSSSMSGNSSYLFLSSLMTGIGLNDRGEEKREVEEGLNTSWEREREFKREGVGLIFLGLCVFNFVFVFKKSK